MNLKKHEERRSASEREARSNLERAISIASQEYKKSMNELYGAGIAIGERLRADHKKLVEVAMNIFYSNSVGITEWLLEEYKEILLKVSPNSTIMIFIPKEACLWSTINMLLVILRLLIAGMKSWRKR